MGSGYRRKLVVVVAALLVSVAGFAAAYSLNGAGALAAGNSGTRPGWGCGDTNHTHTGPPGKHLGNTNPCGTSTETSASTETTGSTETAAASATHRKSHTRHSKSRHHKKQQQRRRG
jgi:hypothetical protein